MNKSRYKYSKYNIQYNHKNCNYIYNIVNRLLVKTNKISINEISDIELNHKEFLIDKKFIIPEYINENKEYVERYNMLSDNKNLHLVIMPSTGCNFDCKYCYFDYEHLNISRGSSNKILEFIKNIIGNYTGIRVDWFGGEPLLAKEEVLYMCKELKYIAKSNKIPIVGTITTNGYNLDIDTFNQLVSYNVTNYQITIDGTRFSHNYYRPLKTGQGTYNIIMENLNDINTKGRGYYFINIRNNVTKENYKSCEEFSRLFYKKYDSNKKFILSKYPVKNWGGDKINNIKEQLVSEKSYHSIINKSMHSDLFMDLDSMRCFASKKNAFVITPDCKIWKCSHISREATERRNNIGIIYSDGTTNIDDREILKWCETEISRQCYMCKFLPECINNHCPKYSMQPSKNCRNILKQRYLENIKKEIRNNAYIQLS